MPSPPACTHRICAPQLAPPEFTLPGTVSHTAWLHFESPQLSQYDGGGEAGGGEGSGGEGGGGKGGGGGERGGGDGGGGEGSSNNGGGGGGVAGAVPSIMAYEGVDGMGWRSGGSRYCVMRVVAAPAAPGAAIVTGLSFSISASGGPRTARGL